MQTQRQVAANAKTKPTILGSWLLSSTPTFFFLSLLQAEVQLTSGPQR